MPATPTEVRETATFQSVRKGTKAQRLAREALGRNLLALTSQSWVDETLRDVVPDAWHTLEQDLDVREPKDKVTLYLDRSVIKFYRAMGNGYQARINRLLATWAQMKIAEALRMEEVLAERLGE